MTLIERLEALTGPCRECDLDLWWEIKANRGSSNEPMPDDYRKSNLRMNDAPRYTASIDAAMTLVPEGCDKWAVSGRNAATVNERHAVVQWSYAATPAIALCIAALKARQ